MKELQIIITPGEVDYLIRDYQTLINLQEMCSWGMFHLISDKIETAFPLSKWVEESKPEEYCKFLDWAKTARFEDLKHALLSESWEK